MTMELMKEKKKKTHVSIHTPRHSDKSVIEYVIEIGFRSVLVATGIVLYLSVESPFFFHPGF